LNVEYPTINSLIESGNYADAFQMVMALLNDFHQALSSTLPKIKDERVQFSLMKFVTQLYVPIYALAGITSGLSGNLNFVLTNFEKVVDLTLLFLSKKRKFYAEAQYLFARAMTALEHTSKVEESTIAWQSIFRLKQAITYFTNTLRMAEDLNFHWLQIKCLIGIADAYFDLESFEEADYILEDVIEHADDMRKELIDFLLNYGNERTRLVDPEIASNYFSKAVSTAFALNDLNLISKTLTKHGHLFNIDEFIENAIELAETTDRREFVVHFKLLKEKIKIPEKPFKYSFDDYTDVGELPGDLQNWMVFSRTHKLEDDHKNILIVCWNGKIGSNLAISETEDRLRDLLAIKSLKMIKLDEGDYKVKDAPDNLKNEYRIHALIYPGNDTKISVKTEHETFVISI
jgi:tetratricopeptide (TPR) repeat protein